MRKILLALLIVHVHADIGFTVPFPVGLSVVFDVVVVAADFGSDADAHAAAVISSAAGAHADAERRPAPLDARLKRGQNHLDERSRRDRNVAQRMALAGGRNHVALSAQKLHGRFGVVVHQHDQPPVAGLKMIFQRLDDQDLEALRADVAGVRFGTKNVIFVARAAGEEKKSRQEKDDAIAISWVHHVRSYALCRWMTQARLADAAATDDILLLARTACDGKNVIAMTLCTFQFLEPGPLIDGELELIRPDIRWVDEAMRSCRHPLTQRKDPAQGATTRQQLVDFLNSAPRGLQTPDSWRSPAYHFWMHWRPEGLFRPPPPIRIAGGIGLRIGSTPELELYSGHIGYHVYPPARGRHFAERSCRLLFNLARRHGMSHLWITCNPDNLASRRTCQRLGAELVEIVPLPADHPFHTRGEREKCRYLLFLG